MARLPRKLQNYFFDHKEDFISLLQKLVEEETPTDKPALFDNLLRILRKEFEDLNYNVKHIKGSETAGQFVCTPPNFDPDNPIQLILGHCDTVWDVGTLEEMPFDVDGDEISGPGVYDMKTGLCMMIWAIRAAGSINKSFKVQPVFLVNSDEEAGSEESKELIIDWAKRAERTFVLEPALGREGKIKTARKGVGDFEITITGEPSHAGLAPDEGVSAILGLSHIVQNLFQLNDPSKGVNINVGTIEGGERSNVVAAQSKAVVDVRVPTKEDGDKITRQIYALESEMEGIDVEVNGEINRPPMEKTKENEQLWEITQQLGEGLDLNLEEGVSGGASDGNFTNLYSPTIDGLGAVGEGAHAWHEKIFLDKTLQRAALFTLLLLEPSLSE